MSKRSLPVLASIVLALSLFFAFAGNVQPAQAQNCNSTQWISTTDFGMRGNLWGYDQSRGNFTGFCSGGGVYTLTRQDTGTGVTVAGFSPGGRGTTSVAEGVKYTFTGHITFRVTGVLKSPVPENTTINLVGTNVHWYDSYFDSVSNVETLDWGWQYTTCGNGSWTDNAATEAAWASGGSMGDISGPISQCQLAAPPPPAQWFSGHDGRINGLAGDRIVVYPHADSSGALWFEIWGVNNVTSKGFKLTSFTEKELLNAGAKGIDHNLGKKLGHVAMNEATTGWFYVSWTGGTEYGASGVGDFSKSFKNNPYWLMPGWGG